MPPRQRDLQDRIRALELELARVRAQGSTETVPGLQERDCHQLAEHLSDVVWISSSDQREVHYVSSGYARILGKPHRAGALWSEGTHPDDQSHIAMCFGAKPDAPVDEEFRIVAPDGELIWIRARVFPILDDGGKHVRNVGVATDVTDQKLFEEALQQSEERWRAIAEDPFDFVVMVDRDGVFQYVNRVEEDVRREDLIGKVSVLDTVSEQDRDGARDAIARAFSSGKPTYYEAHSEVTDEWYGNYVGPIRREGKVILAAILSRDITERRRAEAEIRRLNAELESRVEERTADLERANRELESFAYSISHDLRAPLRAISGFTEVVLEDYLDRLDEDGQDALRRISAGATRMGDLIDQLLNLARISKTELSRQPLDLPALVVQVGEELASTDPSQSVELVVGETPPVQGDPQLLLVVLQNLLGNAWKYTARESLPRVEFGVVPDAAEEPTFFLRDNGVGFDMRYAARLFGAFQRLHHADEFEGTGIGLATVRRIIHRHGGQTWAQAEPGKGATFFFTLPLAGSAVTSPRGSTG